MIAAPASRIVGCPARAGRPLALLAMALTVALLPLPCRGEDDPPADGMPADCPFHAQHMAAAAAAAPDGAHRAEVDARGNVAMGFSQQATQHHFGLTAEGGWIQVTVPDAADTATLTAVRNHLQAISRAFAEGDFSIPQAVHAQLPPGVEGMRAAGEQIHYRYQELPDGGRVSLQATAPLALAAVHDFLRFQIRDHQTGDPLTITD